MKRFDVKHLKTSWEEPIKPKKFASLHKLEDSMEPTPVLNIFEGVEDLLHNFLEVKTPLQQDLFSQGEDMRDSSSLRDQEKGSLDGEAFSNHDEEGEGEQRRFSSTVTSGGDIFFS